MQSAHRHPNREEIEMKPKNFPARKMLRKINANRDMCKPYTEAELKQIEAARQVRTKKDRSGT